jgi:hypothetical protein
MAPYDKEESKSTVICGVRGGRALDIVENDDKQITK